MLYESGQPGNSTVGKIYFGTVVVVEVVIVEVVVVGVFRISEI
tara:strand:+ start:465 stop:593 length:129 start_codon:yes stop_codon:yes gene_type:complete